MDLVTWSIELAVGLACIAVAWALRRSSGFLRVVGSLLLVAGLAAVAHASWAIANG